MLQKSKSKKVNVLKYALIIPVIFAMLFYTSAKVEAQVKTQEVEEIVEVQELSHIQMRKNALKKLIKLEKDGADFFEVFDVVIRGNKSYLQTIEEYYLFSVYTDYLAEKLKRKDNSNKSPLTDNDIDRIAETKSKTSKTYPEYLEWKKTEKVKDLWENSTYNEYLRLLVEDLKSLTTKEEERKKGLMQLLNSDKSFNKLVISDGYNAKVIETEQSVEEIVEVEETEIPFSAIDNAPTFETCKGLTDLKEKKHCTAKTISAFVNKNFNTKLPEKLGLSGRIKIYNKFKINKNGDVVDVKSRAPHPGLETEAERVIGSLPKFIPGENDGKFVDVSYTLPIVFQIKE